MHSVEGGGIEKIRFFSLFFSAPCDAKTADNYYYYYCYYYCYRCCCYGGKTTQIEKHFIIVIIIPLLDVIHY